MSTTALLILDGFGIGKNDPKSNAIVAAGTPVIDGLKEKYCCTAIGASGLDVGLPDGQMGNSEVGHTNIGAGRVVFQILPKITQEIQTGKFFENKVYIKAIAAKFGEEAAAKIRIQYGGSMKGSNVKGLMAQPEIDGGLIGGASLKPVDFATIIAATAQD